MINVVGPPLWGIPFFPSGRQRASSSGGGVGTCCKGASGGVGARGRVPGDLSVIRSLQHVISKDTAAVTITSSIGFAGLSAGVDRLVRRGPVPRGTPRIMIYIVGPGKRIGPTLPARGQGSKLILVRVEVSLGCCRLRRIRGPMVLLSRVGDLRGIRS